MKNNFLNQLMSITAIGCLLFILSCNKKFDQPPINEDPDIPVTMTIQELKALYPAQGSFITVEEDKVISGIVVADDKSGNFYKQIVIQDQTGGIPIRMDQNSLYASYPVGRRVYVKVKGLMLGDYGGNIQLGLDSVRDRDGKYLNLGLIPSALFSKYLITGSFGNEVAPKIVKPSEFNGSANDPLLNILVQINNAEFKDADLAKTYADATQKVSAVNFTIKPCDDTKSIVMRNSSYATFAGLPVPQGNGPLIGISSVFNKTIQLTIRDTADVKFTGTRCSGQAPVAKTITIAELLQYAKGDSTIPAGIRIDGVIVSDTSNESPGNYRVQDATAGIQLRFNKGFNPDGNLNDKISAYVGGLKLSVFRGGLQVSGVETSEVSGKGSVTPRTATIAEIIANARAWESTVVTIKDALFPSKSLIKDATGEVVTFIQNKSGITVYDSAKSVTGYVSIYDNKPQFILRTQADIEGGRNATSTPPVTGATTEDFEKAATKKYEENVVQALETGNWRLGTEVIPGTPSSAGTGDIGNGSKSIRLRGTNVLEAFINTEFDIKGLKTVTLKFGGSQFSESTDADKEIKIELFKSVDGGATWTSIGTKTGSRGVLSEAVFNTNATATQDVRIKIVNISFLRSNNNRLRINVDDVSFGK